MRKTTATLGIVSALTVGAAASALYAQDSRHDGMMSSDGMTGMMGMMQQMSQMMDHCSQMMLGNAGSRPNDQWRREAPEDASRSG